MKKQRKRGGNRGGAGPKRSTASGKVGSNPAAARRIGGKGDFGVDAGDPADRAERLIASGETKHRDRNLGGHEPRSGSEGNRTSGVGGPDSGPGSSSGGDIDTDITAVGTGGSGVSQSGPTGRTTEPDITEGQTIGEPARDTRGERASRGSSKRHGDKLAEHIPEAPAGRRAGKRTIVRGSTIDRKRDATTTGPGQGADATTNPTARGDDSFAGEISAGEAGGPDNAPADRA